MFNFLKSKSSSTESIVLQLGGLHCSSCAVDVDLTLEDLPGVKSSTNYSKSETKIEYDPAKTSLKKIKDTIHTLGYTVN